MFKVYTLLHIHYVKWGNNWNIHVHVRTSYGNVGSILRELLNEEVGETIRHETQPSALSGLETISEFNNSP